MANLFLVQWLSCILLCNSMACSRPASMSFTISWSWLKLMPMQLTMPSNHLILCGPLLLMPSFFPSIMIFSSELALCIWWLKYWSFSFSIRSSNEHPDDLLQDGLVGSPCSPRDSQESSPTPQFKSINSSALSFLYGPTLTSVMTTGKTIALTLQTFVDKVMSLFFYMLSRLVIAFLPRSKCLLISWLQSTSAVILEPKNVSHYFHFFPHLFP